MAIKISRKKRAMIEALPVETKQALLDRQVETLLQDVYEVKSESLISVWSVDLCAADTDYIFANEVREVSRKEVP